MKRQTQAQYDRERQQMLKKHQSEHVIADIYPSIKVRLTAPDARRLGRLLLRKAIDSRIVMYVQACYLSHTTRTDLGSLCWTHGYEKVAAEMAAISPEEYQAVKAEAIAGRFEERDSLSEIHRSGADQGSQDSSEGGYQGGAEG